MSEFLKHILKEISSIIYNFLYILKFKYKFKNTNIKTPLEISISNINNIHISKNVHIDKHLVLRILKNCHLYIGENTYIGPNCHISGTANNIIIGKNVLISDRVFISTTNHKYKNINIPINKQNFISKGNVIISDDCLIGIGSSILSGIHIGKHSLIGANSVVTKNVPSYSVAVGSPAQVIKKYDFNKKQWLRVLGHREVKKK